MGDNGSVWRGSCKCMGIVIGGMKGEGGGEEGGGGGERGGGHSIPKVPFIW